MSSEEILMDGEDRFDKGLEHLREQLQRIRTGRASAALVDNIRVDYYGTATPVSQLASISIPEPRTIVIKPFDASILKELVKAVGQADLGSSPQDDGKVVRLTLPPLSGEQRKKFGAKVRDIGEEARVAMRNTRRDLNKHADVEAKGGGLTEDENRKLHDDVQKLLKVYEGKVDTAIAKKVKEVEEI
ncbi:MAG: ribosome recycling factor [Planctomycetota bacterium]|jgi:ribosome recycling factor